MAHIPVTEPFSGRTPGQGEKELVRETLGARFYIPDDEAKRRLKRYDAADRMRDVEEHHRLYQELYPGAPRTEDHFWVAVDFPGMLARLMRHYTVGRDFSVSAVVSGTQPEVERIVTENALGHQLRQSAEELTTLGDAVFRVDVEDREASDGELRPQAVIRYVSPYSYFPELDPLDGSKAVAVTLAWVFPISGDVDMGEEQRLEVGVDATKHPAGKASELRLAVLREVLRPAADDEESGTREFFLNAWDGCDLGRALPFSAVGLDLDTGPQPTGVRDIPVVHMGNSVRAGRHFGTSDFARIARVFLALENRLSQLDEVLEKHARPKLIVGPGVLDDEAKSNLADFDVIEIEPDILEKAVKPEYLTWDPQLQGITQEIEKLEEYLFVTTETSPASFGLERDGSQVESARALKFKAHRTVNKTDDQRDAMLPAIRLLLKMAQQLEGGYEVSPVRVHFGDAIVEDQEQEVMDYSTLRGAGLVSRTRAVMDLFGLSEEEAEAEVRRILQDEVDDAAAQGRGTEARGIPGAASTQGEGDVTQELGGRPPEAEPSAVA